MPRLLDYGATLPGANTTLSGANTNTGGTAVSNTSFNNHTFTHLKMGEIFQINTKNLTLELEMPLKYLNCVHDAFANMVESAHNYSL